MRYLTAGLAIGLLAVLVARTAAAQPGWQVGVLSGINATILAGAELTYGSRERAGTGFGLGLTARYGFSDRVCVRVDVRGERRAPRIWGAFRDDNNALVRNGFIRRRYDVLVIPLLAQINLTPRIYIFGGPLVQVLRRQAEVSDGNIWYWPGDHPSFAYEDNQFEQMMVDHTGKLARVGAGGLLGVGYAFRPIANATVFLEMSYSLTATEVLRDGFSLYNNAPSLQPKPRYGAPSPRAAFLHTLSVMAGVCFGAAQP